MNVFAVRKGIDGLIEGINDGLMVCKLFQMIDMSVESVQKVRLPFGRQ